MSNGSGLSRGDRNRNPRLARLRELVRFSNAIVGIDLADETQAAAVTDHDRQPHARAMRLRPPGPRFIEDPANAERAVRDRVVRDEVEEHPRPDLIWYGPFLASARAKLIASIEPRSGPSNLYACRSSASAHRRSTAGSGLS